jgi:hypothetical protein
MHTPLPDELAETAAFLTDYEQAMMWNAAVLVADSRGLLMRATAMFGRRVEGLRRRLMQAGSRFGGARFDDLSARATQAVEDVLWSSYEFASFGLDALPRFARPKAARGNRLHKFATTVSGVASGFVGLPGAFLDIPFSTTMILRSIAEVARDFDEDLSSEDTKRACLEVLAFGGFGEAEDATETGYWATRVGMNHAAVSVLIKSAAARFGVVLSEKFLSQAVPVAGAISGGALNYAFTDHYQKMARVHFTLRALERRTGEPGMVKAAFEAMVDAARARRRLGRRDARVSGFLTAG